jgi:hypothetical protein
VTQVIEYLPSKHKALRPTPSTAEKEREREKLFNSFVHLLIGLFVLLVLNFLSSLCILDFNPVR